MIIGQNLEVTVASLSYYSRNFLEGMRKTTNTVIMTSVPDVAIKTRSDIFTTFGYHVNMILC
jgi:hypothetical protein